MEVLVVDWQAKAGNIKEVSSTTLNAISVTSARAV